MVDQERAERRCFSFVRRATLQAMASLFRAQSNIDDDTKDLAEDCVSSIGVELERAMLGPCAVSVSLSSLSLSCSGTCASVCTTPNFCHQ